MNPSRLLQGPLFFLSLLLLLAGRVMALPEIKLEYPVGTEFVDNSTINFGNVAIGDTAAVRVRVRNTGNTRLTITSWAESGLHRGDYRNTTFAPNDYVDATSYKEFFIYFTPSAGNVRTAKLTIYHTDTNDNENPYDLNLTGNGVGPDLRVTQAAKSMVNGGTVNYGSISAGGSASRTFTIKNQGTTALGSVSVNLSGTSDWSYSGAVPDSLGQSQFFQIYVRWSPSFPGGDAATLTISSDDPNDNPFIINLTGTGVNPGEGDLDDFDGDGISNLMEEATGTDKNLANLPPGTFVINGTNGEFTYTRSTASTASMIVNVETADTAEAFATVWAAPVGVVETVVTSDGITDQMLATWPLPSTPSHFVRLRVTRP